MNENGNAFQRFALKGKSKGGGGGGGGRREGGEAGEYLPFCN